jgi:hypothetical protein
MGNNGCQGQVVLISVRISYQERSGGLKGKRELYTWARDALIALGQNAKQLLLKVATLIIALNRCNYVGTACPDAALAWFSLCFSSCTVRITAPKTHELIRFRSLQRNM